VVTGIGVSVISEERIADRADELFVEGLRCRPGHGKEPEKQSKGGAPHSDLLRRRRYFSARNSPCLSVGRLPLPLSLPYKRAMAYSIVFAVPGMAFAGDALDKQSLGGSETAALHMARELARLGHRVAVFSHNNGPRLYNGVTYYPVDQWDSYTRVVP